jgi:hypothetical protein
VVIQRCKPPAPHLETDDESGVLSEMEMISMMI